ncbi:uncharacterized protein LOC106062451 [Biomphalaria glabrata]|uniref:Uncharacterized protein LOC106062451 n=1 Tax=Biomphalaria glabrata TaxID=6526 RepID=A0A9U8E7T3_BIOGL|nr:uncharacterized protein LOC106062451 [Biomphalaria glabrata]
MLPFLLLLVLPTLGAAVLTNVTPQTVNVGLTRNLQVECLFSTQRHPTITLLMSLSLYHSQDKTESGFRYLASVNSSDEEVHADKSEDSKAIYTGRLNDDESFLRVVWEFPRSNHSGVYKCEVSGLNVTRKAVSLSSTAAVADAQPDNQHLLEEMHKIIKVVENLQARMNSTEKRVDALDNLRKLKSNEQNDIMNALFVVSPVFQERKYLLIRNQLHITAYLAEVLCGIFGGYLAEIDSEQEFLFIRDKLLALSLFSITFFGATDEKHEGLWINRHSQTAAQFIKWGPGEPNGGVHENCATFVFHTNDYYVDDFSCGGVHAGIGFVCEVESKE